MTENPAQRYRRLADRFDEVVSSVPADRWDAASPCEGWTVADVVVHVADTELDFLERHDLTSGEAPGDPIERWRAARSAMQTAIDDPRVAERSFDGYFGPTTFEQTVDTFYAMDLAVHAWDVARGAGLPEFEDIGDDDIAHARTQLAIAGDTIRMGGIFGEQVTVADDASSKDRFLAWTGRRP